MLNLSRRAFVNPPPPQSDEGEGEEEESGRVRELTETTERQEVEIQQLKSERADILSQVEAHKLTVSD